KLLVFATGTGVAGTFGVIFSASVSGRTKSLPGIVSVDLVLSGLVIVAVPSSPTVTTLPSWTLPLLASYTLVLTLAFSPSVKLLIFATGTGDAGTFGVIFSASVSGRTKSLPGIVSVDLILSVGRAHV